MIYVFGDCELDLGRFELRRAGAIQPVEPQVFDVLAALVRLRYRVVPKEELLDTVWGNRFVSESALTSRIKAARRAIGDNGRSQQLIRTVHGRGYQFIGEVRETAPAASDEAIVLARRRVRIDPLSEPAGRELVRLLASSGDWAGALEAAHTLVERLHQELGLAPDAETLELVAQVRSSVDAATSPSEPAPVRLPAPPAVRGLDVSVVGRDAVLEQIKQIRLASSRSGASVVLVSGDAGIGKTSVVLTAARAAASEGLTTLYGRCDEEGIVPFGPWVEAIGHVLDHLHGDRIAQIARAGGPAVLRLFPGLRDRLPELALIPSHAEPDTERWRLFEAMSTLLHGLSAEAAVLVIDDVHWADRSTLLLLRHLLRSRRPDPITVLVTCRATELPADSFLHALLAEIRRAEMLTEIELPGLDERDVDELVARRRGSRGERVFVRNLHRETEGNPFFVEEILRGRRLAAPASGGASEATGFAVPQGVQDLVHRRLGQLPQEVTDVLAVAAVAGRDFDLDLLESLLNMDEQALLDALDQAIGAGMITETGVGHYAFGHALFRAAIYDGLTRTRRARLHLALARALESKRAAGTAERVGEIAHHYLAAGHAARLDRAIEYSWQAYARATGQLAYEEAAAIARRAVAALDDAGAAAVGTVGVGELHRMLVAVGDAESRAGNFSAARLAYGRVAELADLAGDGALLAKAALGFAGPTWRSFGEVDQSAVTLLERALRRVPGDDLAMRTMLQARLAVKLYFAGAPGRVAELTDAAVAGARTLDDAMVMAMALEARLWAYWHPDGVQERLDTAVELLQLAEQHNLDEVAAVARRWRAVALLEAGRMAEARTEVAEHARTSRALRLPYELMYVAVFATMRAMLEGRVEDAKAESAHVAAFGELRGGADALQFVGVHHLTLALLQGDFGGLAEAIQDYADGYPGLPAWRAGLALVLAETGRAAESAAEGARLWPPESTLPRDAVWLPGHAMLALAVARLGDRERAEHLYPLLLPYEDRPVVLGAGGAIWGTVALCLGTLAATFGDAERAGRHFDDATAWLTAAGATPWPALVDVVRGATVRASAATAPAPHDRPEPG